MAIFLGGFGGIRGKIIDVCKFSKLMSFYSLVFEAFIGCQQCIFFLLKLSGSHVIKVSSDSGGNLPFRIVFNIFLTKI